MIFVIAEHRDSKLKPITSEMLVFAQRVGRDFGQPITMVILGTDTAGLADQLKGKKIDRVITVEHEQLANYNPDSYVEVLKELIQKEKPLLVLIGHTRLSSRTNFRLPEMPAYTRSPIFTPLAKLSGGNPKPAPAT